MLQIDALTSADIHAALGLSSQAVWNQIESDWSRLIELNPQACLAGRLDGRIVATATLACFDPRSAWVGMVLVDVECRGQGFGGQIMDAILARAKELGIDSVGLDATDAGRPIYAKRGFVDVCGLDRRVLPGTQRRHAIRSDDDFRDVDWPALLKFDSAAVGIDRSKLLTRLRNESDCRVTRRAGRVTGFAFRREGRLVDQIGPVVAESANDSKALIESLSSIDRTSPPRDLILDSPRGGPLDTWLDSIQFAVSRRLTRMVAAPTGRAVPLLGPHVFAAAGLELG